MQGCSEKDKTEANFYQFSNVKILQFPKQSKLLLVNSVSRAASSPINWLCLDWELREPAPGERLFFYSSACDLWHH